MLPGGEDFFASIFDNRETKAVLVIFQITAPYVFSKPFRPLAITAVLSMPLVPSSGLCNSTAPWFPHVWALAREEESKSFPRMSTVFGLGILQCKPIILQPFEVSNACSAERKIQNLTEPSFTSRCCFSSCSLEVMSPRRLLGGVPGLWRERKK